MTCFPKVRVSMKNLNSLFHSSSAVGRSGQRVLISLSDRGICSNDAVFSFSVVGPITASNEMPSMLRSNITVIVPTTVFTVVSLKNGVGCLVECLGR